MVAFRASRLLLGTMAMIACTTEPCTLIGCNSGLSVEVSGISTEALRVVVELPGGSLQERQCQASSPCSVFFQEVTASSVIVRILAPDAVIYERATELEYRHTYPNGPDCGPECRNARVEIKPLD